MGVNYQNLLETLHVIHPLHSRNFFILPSSPLSSPIYVNSHRSHRQITKHLSHTPNLLSSLLSRKMDVRFSGFESPLLHALHNMLDSDDSHTDKSVTAPTRSYVRDAKAMAATPADIKEYPNSYVFVVDMPGLKSGDIKVQVEDGNVLLISGERKREEEKEGIKYVRMERRIGKFMRKFVLPDNADTDRISAVCQDGVLTVTVEKVPPPEPKKPKTIEVKIG